MGVDTGSDEQIRQVLETKLYKPRPRAGLVRLERLQRRLDAGLRGKLTLVSASPGFGKTTVLAAWLDSRQAETQVAWVSLDASDNDPVVFWTYVITGLQRAQPGLGESTLAALHSRQPVDIEVALGAMLNDLAGLDGDTARIVLVLDDYHVIDTQAIHRGMTYLLDHMPPGLHLVLASRADPPLPLSRLRARGELTELRAADLRFSTDEAAAFLTDAMHLELGLPEVTALEARTEGWIAGLQLAAISLQGQRNVADRISAFAGDSRYIVDYLADEVLHQLPEAIRSFLRDTSILERLSGPLCDAVTRRTDGQEMLERLERSNLFVVPLDERRGWYRYHHLFADVLRAYLLEKRSDRVRELHRRAARWFEANGMPDDAIQAALAGEDFTEAARLIELQGPAMLRGRREATLLGWLKALPDGALRWPPTLCAGYGWALLLHGRIDEAEVKLSDAERSLQADGDGLVVANEAWFQSLPGSIATGRAFIAHARGSLKESAEYARRSLDLLPAEDDSLRGVTGAILATACRRRGELDEAERACLDALAAVGRTGDLTSECGLADILAQVHIQQGRLRDAADVCHRTLAHVLEQPPPPARGTISLHVMLSEIERERDNFEAAERWLRSTDKLDARAALPESPFRVGVSRARLLEARGDLAGALAVLHEAKGVRPEVVTPGVPPIEALEARLQIASGNLDQALAWSHAHEIPTEQDLDPVREFEHITLARLLMAQYAAGDDENVAEDLARLLEGLEHAAFEAGRNGSLIEVLVLQALFADRRGDLPDALGALGRAVTLAEPEGYVRVFVKEGDAMRRLLGKAVTTGVGSSYCSGLLRAFGDQPAATVHVAAQALPEPLTARELEILRLVAGGLRNQEIADHLVISVATVKRHIANAYGKLGVDSRTGAVARAAELALL